ncbi:hypothetical protein EW146_g74 [Bondarzewia mesenterica]|uniref:F-box/LRR-repeat protein 15/At3g58940/PEG3-like LRR domain-containing protein n=1 Tax=Bondarzewia mesenterica TaxID=1095465 RepID=A0A4S4M9X6_9AGAM|nr:hypothetical protein EW146_g74 [Bondarzewia mesenterica]
MHPTPTPRRRLVDDLIPVILDCGNWWSNDYLRLALVSQAWSWHAQKRLYAFPQLYSYRACALLARTLVSNPFLASLVQALDLRPVAGDRTFMFCDTTSIRLLLSSVSVKRLVLREELSIRAERFLPSLGDPHCLEDLTIDGFSYACHGSSTAFCSRKSASLVWDSKLSCQFSNLRRLRLSYVELSILHCDAPGTLRLTHLSLNKVTIVNGNLPNLSSTSWDDLRHLDIVARDDADLQPHLPLLLRSCSSSLEELRVHAWGTNCEGLIFDSAAMSFPSLVEMRLTGIDTNRRTLSNIEQCCPKLERLCIFGRAVRVTPREWIAFLDSGALPTLRGFRPPCDGRHICQLWTDEDRKRVLDVCLMRAIEPVYC